ncbi:MAG: trypsin-like peptidase domain-containing protein [Clostridia bacterium]|nr:trypsin-like peptidase domain-containing protein [Clostridia bacterium]
MKKVIISLILSIIAIFSLAVSASAAYYGDVDGSGKVTASDARIILRVAAKMDTISDDKVIFADANRDGKITAADARTVLRMAAKLEDFVEITTSGTEPSTRPPETTTKAPETTTKAPETTTKTPEPPSSLTAIEVHDIASKYTVEVQAQNDQYISTGSGFFTTTDGKVVTNYHVIDGMYEIFVTDYNGNTYDVVQVLAYSEDMDIAVLKVNAKSTPAVLNYATPRTGAVAYTLGSSKGMTDTFSNGIISNGSRVVEEYHPTMSYIQTTAPISQGNSGGPLINDMAEVIGINSWMRTDGQNLNFAIPVKYINELDYSNPLTMEEFGDLFRADEPDYPDYPDDPDTPSGTLSLEVNMDSFYLDKGGTAIVDIEVIGDLGGLSLIVDYDSSTFRCEWEENWYVYGDSGNDVAVLYVSPLKYTSAKTIKVYVEGYEDSIYTTFTVSAASDGWWDYGGYPGAVDYGAYTRVAPYYYYMSEEADAVAFYYDINSLFAAGHSAEVILTEFFEYLEYYGYEYVDYMEDSSGASYTFYNEEYDVLYMYTLVYDDYGDITDVMILFMP